MSNTGARKTRIKRQDIHDLLVAIGCCHWDQGNDGFGGEYVTDPEKIDKVEFWLGQFRKKEMELACPKCKSEDLFCCDCQKYLVGSNGRKTAVEP